MHARLTSLLAPVLIGGLSACTLGPDYRPPAPAALGVPNQFYLAAGARAPTEAELASWWTQFREPALDALIATALANNTDIAVSRARLVQARESLTQARAAALPQVSGTANAGRNLSCPGPDSSSFSLNGSASWTADLFGGTARSIEASRADLAASGYDLANLHVAIVSQLVTSYVQARLAQEQLRIARETLAIQQNNFEITGWRVQAGLASSLDVEQARAQLAQTTAQIPQQEASLRATLNSIAVLIGAAPGEATRMLETPAPIPAAPVALTAGIPADALRQRPDVQAAERRLGSATARIGVAEAQLYPQLSLSGNLGTSARSVGSLTDLITGGLFARVAQTIFDGGRLQAQVRSQRAAADAAFATYKGVVINALGDVEDAVASLTAARARQVQLKIAVEAANNSAILARIRYQSGLSDFLTLQNAEQSLLSARQSLAGAQSDEAIAIARLYAALGGGWQMMDGKPQ